jgi:hypothetical protein
MRPTTTLFKTVSLTVIVTFTFQQLSFAFEPASPVSCCNITQQPPTITTAELKPIIHDTYRDIMGRDPGDAEMSDRLAAIGDILTHTLDVAALKTYLYNTTEYIERTAKVNQIRGDIESELTSYVTGTPESQVAYLAALGLSPDEVRTLSSDELAVIITCGLFRGGYSGDTILNSLTKSPSSFIFTSCLE